MHFSPSPHPFYSAMLVLHVAGGFVAMYGGLVPLWGKKGSVDHRRWGWIFTSAMAICALSAFPLAWFRSDVLQAGVGLFAGYSAFLGVRILRRHRQNATVLRRETLVAVGALFSFFALCAWGALQKDGAAILFSVLGSALAIRDFTGLHSRDFSPARRVTDHLLATTLSLSSAFSAFFNTQLHALTGLNWSPFWKMATPIAVALPAILFFAFQWHRKLSRPQKSTSKTLSPTVSP